MNIIHRIIAYAVTHQSNLNSENDSLTANQANQATNQANQATNQAIDLKPIEEEVLQLIMKTPEISQTKISQLLNIPLSTIKYNVKELREKNVIYREGTSQKGKWIINKKF